MVAPRGATSRVETYESCGGLTTGRSGRRPTWMHWRLPKHCRWASSIGCYGAFERWSSMTTIRSCNSRVRRSGRGQRASHFSPNARHIEHRTHGSWRLKYPETLVARRKRVRDCCAAARRQRLDAATQALDRQSQPDVRARGQLQRQRGELDSARALRRGRSPHFRRPPPRWRFRLVRAVPMTGARYVAVGH